MQHGQTAEERRSRYKPPLCGDVDEHGLRDGPIREAGPKSSALLGPAQAHVDPRAPRGQHPMPQPASVGVRDSLAAPAHIVPADIIAPAVSSSATVTAEKMLTDTGFGKLNQRLEK